MVTKILKLFLECKSDYVETQSHRNTKVLLPNIRTNLKKNNNSRTYMNVK